MPACLIPVQMEAPVPPWPTSSPANACQASQGRNVRLTSMSVTFQDNASMVAPASTSQDPISASAPRASPASTVTTPTCHVHPRPVSMEAPAGRPATSLLSATAFQVRSPLVSWDWEMHLCTEGGGGCGWVAPVGSVLPSREKGKWKFGVRWVTGEGGVFMGPMWCINWAGGNLTCQGLWWYVARKLFIVLFGETVRNERNSCGKDIDKSTEWKDTQEN